MTSAQSIVRIYRDASGPGRLLLFDGHELYDLTSYLRQHGQPTDLVGLFETGWFDREQFTPKLPGAVDKADAWTLAGVEWDGNAPAKAGLPLAHSSVGKILALGKNFRAHAQEFGEEVPAEPLFFNKLPETLVPHGHEVHVPAWYEGRVDHEAELCVVIALEGHSIAVDDAMEHVGGYMVANDLTARSIQGSDREQQYPWFRSKNLDGFCPVGPGFVPRDFLDVSDLRVSARVGDEVRQDASTRDLVVDIPHAIAWLSKHLTLHPGDLILMGTPAGVGPLLDGDEVHCSVEGIGTLSNRIRRRQGD